MSIEFRYARSEEYPRISEFINEYWAKDHVYVRNRALFDWTFQRPGYAPPGHLTFALAEDGSDLIGILGGIPFTFNVQGSSRNGVWIVNYAIRPDHRKGAAALKLLSTFRNASYQVVIASGLNPATVAIYKVLRGQVLAETPRHFLVFPGARERAARLISLANPEWDITRSRELASAFEYPMEPESAVRFGSAIPPEWDEMDWPEIASSTTGAVRDAAYLKWRYLDHPNFQYRILTLPEGSRHGLAVWRLETIRQEVGEQRQDFDRIGRVVEFLPASKANGGQLLGGLLAQIQSEGALGADFYSYHGQTRQILADNGFPSVDTHPDGPAIPSRLQPIAAGGGVLNAMFADPDLPGCGAAYDCTWYWTKSDSDQDRPN